MAQKNVIQLSTTSVTAGSFIEITIPDGIGGYLSRRIGFEEFSDQVNSVNEFNKGFYPNEAAIIAAFPVGEAGWYCINGDTDTVWLWDTGTNAWVDSGQNGAVVSVNGNTGTVVLSAVDIPFSSLQGLSSINVRDAIDEVKLYTDAAVSAVGGVFINDSRQANNVAVTTGDNVINFAANFADVNYTLVIEDGGVGYEIKSQTTSGFTIETYDNGSINYIAISNNAAGTQIDAENIPYDNTSSGLTSTNVQDAIDELAQESAASAETTTRTIYYSTTGNDTTGDGTVGTPFLTLLRALQDVKSTVNSGVTITLQAVAGTYAFEWAPITSEMRRIILVGSAELVFSGSMIQTHSGLTLVAQSPEAYIYDVTGDTFTADELQGKFLLNGSEYVPIATNGTTTINAEPGNAAATSVYEPQVIFQLSDNEIQLAYDYPALGSSQRTTFDSIKVEFGAVRGNIYTKSCITDIQNCVFTANDFQVTNQSDQAAIKNTSFVGQTGGLRHAAERTSLQNIAVIKQGSRSGVGVRYSYQGFVRANRSIYVHNFTDGFEYLAGNYLYNTSGRYRVIDATNAFSLRNNLNVTSLNEQIYITSNVSYLFADSETPLYNYGYFIHNLTGTPSVDYLNPAMDALGYYDIDKNINLVIPGVSAPVNITNELAAATRTRVGAEAVTYATNTAIDLLLADVHNISTVTGNMTLDASNVEDGQTGAITWTMDGTGGYTIATGTGTWSEYSDSPVSIGSANVASTTYHLFFFVTGSTIYYSIQQI